MKRDYATYLDDVTESIGKIDEYTRGIGFEEFQRDSTIQDAVLRRMEIIGEAVKHIPLQIRQANPEVPWREIAGLRDVLIHGYFSVNTQRVWNTVKNDLPEFKKAIRRIYAELGKKPLPRSKP